jgi:hypothetical protein
LLIIAAWDGGEHLWPYIALTLALLPAGLFGVVLLALAADGLPPVLGGGVVAIGVVLLAALNILLARTLCAWCRRRSATAA